MFLGFWVRPNVCEDFDFLSFAAPIRHTQSHFAMSESVSGMWSEGQFRPEDCLALETLTLADEEMVVVPDRGLHVDIKYL